MCIYSVFFQSKCIALLLMNEKVMESSWISFDN